MDIVLFVSILILLLFATHVNDEDLKICVDIINHNNFTNAG